MYSDQLGKGHLGPWDCSINLKIKSGLQFTEFQRPGCFSCFFSHRISLMSLKSNCGYKALLVICPALWWWFSPVVKVGAEAKSFSFMWQSSSSHSVQHTRTNTSELVKHDDTMSMGHQGSDQMKQNWCPSSKSHWSPFRGLRGKNKSSVRITFIVNLFLFWRWELSARQWHYWRDNPDSSLLSL